MKIFLVFIFLFFSILSHSPADIKQPGKINSLKCTIGALDAYFELQEYLEKKPKYKGVVYLACDTSSGEYSWTWQSSKKIEKAHTKAFKNCTKYSTSRGTGECFFFAENNKIVWKLSDRRMSMFKKTLAKKQNNEPIEKDDNFTFDGSWNVKSSENDFVKFKNQKKELKFKKKEDEVPGRYLFDQEDVTDDYQVHAIYILAADSKDKQLDTKGIIEKIVFKANKHMKKKTKGKELRLDLTKDGKLDVSFLRVDRTKKQINVDDAATYLAVTAVKNGFYHPKKIYTIFYQDKYRDEEGQVGQAMLIGEKGNVEIVSGVTYLGRGTQDAWKIHLHEIFHALGFVQLCAPGVVTEKNSRWGKNDHLKYSGDIMSNMGGDANNIDKKNTEYFGHSNLNCPMDLKKSAYLVPTEEKPQLLPYLKDCVTTRRLSNYSHKNSLNCLAKLEF